MWAGGCGFVADGKAVSTLIQNCAYLVNQPGLFQWIPSSNGIVENGAVVYGSAVVGKGREYSKAGGRIITRIGEVSMQRKALVTMVDSIIATINNYQVLIYVPHQTTSVPGELKLLLKFQLHSNC